MAHKRCRNDDNAKWYSFDLFFDLFQAGLACFAVHHDERVEGNRDALLSVFGAAGTSPVGQHVSGSIIKATSTTGLILFTGTL
jgi:hypothetical protein